MNDVPSPDRQRVVDGTNQQIGEQSFGTVAGGNATIHDPEPWLVFFRTYLHDIDQGRNRRDEELAHELAEARKALSDLAWQFSDYQRMVSDRFAADAIRRRTDRLFAAATLFVAVAALGIALFL